MSTATEHGPQTAERASPPGGTAHPLRGPVRAVWAQHRRTAIATGVLVVLALAVVIGLLWWWEALGGSADSTARDSLTRALGALTTLTEYGAQALALLPLAVGAFVAGPMIARELESGTYKIAWTQSMSPAQWLMAKLAVPLGGVLVATSVLVVAFRLLRGSFTGPHSPRFAWYEGGVFQALGPVTVAGAVLGVTVGALAGLLVRRTLLAMVTTVLAVGAVLVTLQWWRVALWPVLTWVGGGTGPQGRAWVSGEGWQTAAGARIDTSPCVEVAARAASEAERDIYSSAFDTCVAERGGVTPYMDYHPASHFWPLQLVETGILLALAGAAAFAAFRLLRRLHG